MFAQDPAAIICWMTRLSITQNDFVTMTCLSRSGSWNCTHGPEFLGLLYFRPILDQNVTLTKWWQASSLTYGASIRVPRKVQTLAWPPWARLLQIYTSLLAVLLFSSLHLCLALTKRPLFKIQCASESLAMQNDVLAGLLLLSQPSVFKTNKWMPHGKMRDRDSLAH